MKWLILCLSFFTIGNASCHERNNEIICQVIEKYVEQAPEAVLNSVGMLGRDLLEHGFDLSIYSPNGLRFATIPLWEGGAQCPLTVILYIWPSKKEVLTHNACQAYFASNIHSHPIDCALTVLQGEVTEHYFQRVEGFQERVVKETGKKTFFKHDQEVDFHPSTFIHQVVCESETEPLAITLHIYGRGSANEVFQEFRRCHSETTYLYVLEEDHTITERLW